MIASSSSAFERGVAILGCGETSFRLSPPLVLNQQEATIGLQILEECVLQVELEFAKQASRTPSA